MCDPTTLMYVAIGTQAGGQLAGARAQRGQLAAQANAADAQATEIERQAYTQGAQTREEALAQAQQIRKAATQVRSTGRAGYAQAGVRVDAPGSVDIYDREILYDSEADAGLAILTGERRAGAVERGGSLDAASLRAGAANARTAGADAMRAGYIGAASTLLSGYANLSRWSSAMQPKPVSTGSRGYFGYGDPAAGP